jgi:tetratricopeptide (TPR) repeat protein
VPELLNETSGDPHIIVTQNALADGNYLDFLHDLYGDNFNTLTQEDSQRAFQDYATDAQKRLQHDLDFPDEPKQVRPGEDIKMTDGRVQISGQVAVMALNEKLLQTLMQKNPDLSFAMEESFSLPATYAGAVPLGPLMELGVNDAQTKFTQDRATQSVDYWRSVAQNLLADPEATASDYTLRAYSHDVNATANLLAARNFTTEAEQAYRLATQICPYDPQAVTGLAGILNRTGRATDAQALLDNFVRSYPNQRTAIETFRGTITLTATKSP